MLPTSEDDDQHRHGKQQHGIMQHGTFFSGGFDLREQGIVCMCMRSCLQENQGFSLKGNNFSHQKQERRSKVQIGTCLFIHHTFTEKHKPLMEMCM